MEIKKKSWSGLVGTNGSLSFLSLVLPWGPSLSLSKAPVPEAEGRPQLRPKGSFGPQSQGSSLARIGPSLATNVSIWDLKTSYLGIPKRHFSVITGLIYIYQRIFFGRLRHFLAIGPSSVTEVS